MQAENVDPYGDYRDEGGAGEVDKLEQLASLVAAHADAQEHVARCQAALADAQEVVRKIEMVDIPEIMDELSIEKFSMQDGTEIAVSEKIRCSIPAAKRAMAYNWLLENDYENMVKTILEVDLGKADQELIANNVEALQQVDENAPVSVKQTVHNATLVSWVTEKLEEGVELPEEFFPVLKQRFTKIKKPK